VRVPVRRRNVTDSVGGIGDSVPVTMSISEFTLQPSDKISVIEVKTSESSSGTPSAVARQTRFNGERLARKAETTNVESSSVSA
jgi:hypothetical protein